MEEYALAKKLLFTAHHPAWSVFNLDDQTASRFNAELPNRKLGYALDSARGADICATELEMSADGIRMRVQFPPDSRREAGDAPARSLFLQSPLRGRFNASNLLAACAVGFALGLEPEVIVEALRKAKGAPGRFEAVHAGQPFAVYVDYAHTPDAVERLLLSARQITPNRLIAVLGCGGDRDATKRPLMGAALGRLADFSVITNDNPRTEDPASIAKQMEAGIKRETGPEAYAVVLDRGAAIRLAIEKARPGDTVVIAGKGHEDYQIIGDKKTHFDDREEALRLIRERFPEEKDKT
jgi:UDP-N-acetylmuramoyl-L-alanyl-D-glutamate--2,6-diaminopimelate ligase